MILICNIAKIIPPLTLKKFLKTLFLPTLGVTKGKVRKVKNVIPTLGVTKGRIIIPPPTTLHLSIYYLLN